MTDLNRDLAASEPNRAHPAFRLATASAEVPLALRFPGDAEIQAPASADQRPVHIIPQAGVPRWILPQQTSRALTVLSSWKPYSLKSFLQWKVILAVCRVGALARVPGMMQGALQSDASYWEQFLPSYDPAWAPVVYVGHPSPTRKAIIFFVDPRAQVKAVAKVPIQLAASQAILNEASVLQYLSHRLPLPQVLFSDSEEGIAAQSWMEGGHVSSRFQSAQLELLSCLATEGAQVFVSDHRDRLAAALESQDVPLHAALRERALSLLEFNEALPAFTEHRDCVPWNMRRLVGGRLTLIDWEWALQQGLPWQDVCRYFYMQDYLFKKSANVWDILTQHAMLAQYRRRFALSPAAIRALTMHYLLRSLCDDHLDGNLDRAAYLERKMQELLH